MAREARKESSTKIYHIVNRGVERRSIFAEKRERTRMINIIRENWKKYQVNFYAYCIMPNHFHMLVQADLKTLALFIAVISARYALYYNYKHRRSGYVFQNRYRSQCVENEAYFWNCLRYIHLNPVKAKLSDDLVSYHHGSMREYFTILEEDEQILCPEAFGKIKERFGNGRNFLEFHEQTCQELFIDTREEEFEQKVEIAEQILNACAAAEGISLIEALDYAEVRKRYEAEVKQALNISWSNVENIRNTVRNRLV